MTSEKREAALEKETGRIEALLGLPTYLIATAVAFLNPYVSVGICTALWIFWAFTFYEGSH